MGLKRAYFKINYRLYVYFYRAITPIKYLLLLLSSVNICYLPSHFIYLLYLPQCSDFKNRSHRMEKGYQWKRIFLSPGKTKLNKTFEHSSWGEKNILNFCEGNILALSFAWNFFSKTRSHPLSVTEFSDSTAASDTETADSSKDPVCWTESPGKAAAVPAPWAHRHVWGPAALPTDASCHQVSPHVTCFTRALHFHYQSRYRILGVLEDILSGTFPGATFRPCG